MWPEVQLVQVAALPESLKLPAEQSAQVLSALGVPSVSTCCPATQLVIAGQVSPLVPATLKVSAAQAPHVRSVVASGVLVA